MLVFHQHTYSNERSDIIASLVFSFGYAGLNRSFFQKTTYLPIFSTDTKEPEKANYHRRIFVGKQNLRTKERCFKDEINIKKVSALPVGGVSFVFCIIPGRT